MKSRNLVCRTRDGEGKGRASAFLQGQRTREEEPAVSVLEATVRGRVVWPMEH